MKAFSFAVFFSALLLALSAMAQPVRLPTANHALFESGGEERFFVGTAGKPWLSGTFGCVRSDDRQMHEGLDIRCLERDRHGEPSDQVMAAADGTVVYFSNRPALSNYGKYLILRHEIEGLEIYSLYAHLSEIRSGLALGQAIKAGEPIAVMGRTTNTRERITKDRAHVHFELNLLYSDRFAAWFKKTNPWQRNDHGLWNGQNLAGLDSRLVLLDERREGAKFNLLRWLQNRSELCRIFVRKTDFPWLHRYHAMVASLPVSGTNPVEGYELVLDYNGIPFQLIPRTSGEVKGKGRYQLLSVNAAEYEKNPCRKLVVRRGNRWQLGSKGIALLELLTF